MCLLQPKKTGEANQEGENERWLEGNRNKQEVKNEEGR